MPNPIGIKFLPSADAAQEGPRRGALEGVPQQAFKILSLRLPRVVGAAAPSPANLLNSRGGAGMNPQAAVFEALIAALRGRRGPASPGGAPAPIDPTTGSGQIYDPAPEPRLPPKIGYQEPGGGGPPSPFERMPKKRVPDTRNQVPY